jgi:hypothetical protein
MTFFRWVMRYGAAILFCVSLLIFVISFVNYFVLEGEALNRALAEEQYTNSKIVLFFGSLAQAASASVWSFFGACLLYRLDRYWGGREEPRT